jgi:hypothetical protein
MKLINILLFFSFLFFILSITITTNSDFNQDLGRHLKIGEIIIQSKNIPKTNLFSYTNPDFPFINHHWLSEVIFYFLQNSFGILSLQYLKILLITISLLLVFYVAAKQSSILSAGISSLLFVPIIMNRLYIRPELFGYLFFSILLFIYFSYPKQKKLLYAIPLIMLLWINMHITFIFGIILIFFIFLKIYFSQKKFIIHNSKFLILLVSIFVLIINPSGIDGVLYPLRIFQNYGYQIAENQNLFFLSGMMDMPVIKYFFYLTPVILFIIVVLVKKRKFLELCLFFLFYFFAFYQIRHFPFFVLAAIPLGAQTFEPLLLKIIKFSQIKKTLSILLTLLFILLTIFIISGSYVNIFEYNSEFGLKFYEDGKNAAKFVKQNKLPKNIFNNFDIGGYLIYRLYPQYKLFVDNRPEAYPKDFFQNIYVPMHTDKNLRDDIFRKYNIHTIIFSHTDQTQWARAFLDQIIKDNSWRLVYFDDTMTVFSDETTLPDKKNDKNYFLKLIAEENEFIGLLKLTNFFDILGQQEFSRITIEKAGQINPDSCIIKRIIYSKYTNSPLLIYQAEEIKKNSWWCF